MPRLTARLLALAHAPRAPLWLGLVAFAEASVFPLPPDLFLAPMAMADRKRAGRLALITTLASVLGGAVGYLLGWLLFDHLAHPLLRLYHLENAYTAFQAAFARYGLAFILIKGLTPIPYKLVAIAAGAARFDFLLFLAASLLTRGARFFLVAALAARYGAAAAALLERRLRLVFTLLLLLAGLYALFRFLSG
jgi:membrane protein YqaA with SNARE-associated domain